MFRSISRNLDHSYQLVVTLLLDTLDDDDVMRTQCKKVASTYLRCSEESASEKKLGMISPFVFWEVIKAYGS